jgi:hypothetical protein
MQLQLFCKKFKTVVLQIANRWRHFRNFFLTTNQEKAKISFQKIIISIKKIFIEKKFGLVWCCLLIEQLHVWIWRLWRKEIEQLVALIFLPFDIYLSICLSVYMSIWLSVYFCLYPFLSHNLKSQPAFCLEVQLSIGLLCIYDWLGTLFETVYFYYYYHQNYQWMSF